MFLEVAAWGAALAQGCGARPSPGTAATRRPSRLCLCVCVCVCCCSWAGFPAHLRLLSSLPLPGLQQFFPCSGSVLFPDV